MTKMKLKLQTGGNTAPAPDDGKVTGLLDAFVVVARSRGMLLTPMQLIKDNLFESDRITIPDLVICAQRAGMKAKLVRISGGRFRQAEEDAAGHCRAAHGRSHGPE